MILQRRNAAGHRTCFGRAIHNSGIGRLVYYCYFWPRNYWRRKSVPNHPVEIELFNYRLFVPPPAANFCYAHIYRFRNWEAEVTREVRRRIKPGMCVAHVGADIGYFVLLSASLVQGGKIVAFEPNPNSYSYLAETIRRNRLDTVNVYQFGLGDRPIANATYSFATSQTFFDSNSAAKSDETATRIEVFDEIMAEPETNLSKLDFALIDVEGAELNVLSGMARTIERDRPMLLIEIHGQLLPRYGHTKGDLVDWLRQRGYSAHWIAGESLDDAGCTHALFIPEGRT